MQTFNFNLRQLVSRRLITGSVTSVRVTVDVSPDERQTFEINVTLPKRGRISVTKKQVRGDLIERKATARNLAKKKLEKVEDV